MQPGVIIIFEVTCLQKDESVVALAIEDRCYCDRVIGFYLITYTRERY